MTINERALRWEYVVGDFIMANLAWFLLNIYRYSQIGYKTFHSISHYLTAEREIQLQVLIPLFWMAIYYYSGYYNNPVHRDRLQELRVTIISAVIGTLFVFFLAILKT